MKTFPFVLRSAALFGVCQVAFAAPFGCVAGYQDNTCIQSIASAPQIAPACSSDPGWITTAPAQWQGSHYSAPLCSYQAPPTCPGGYTQTAGPWWNGASWVGLQCTPSVPPRASTPDQQQACVNTAAAYGYRVNSPSAFVGPQSETTGQVVNDMNTQPLPRICQAPGSSWAGGTRGDLPPTNGPYDVYKLGFLTYVLTNSNAGDEGTTYNVSSQIMACMLNPGTTQVVGFRIAQSHNAIGGPCGR